MSINLKYDNITKQTAKTIQNCFWNGRDCISEMKIESELDKINYGWRQMEWAGFYFEYLLKKKADNNIVPFSDYYLAGGNGKTKFDFYDENNNFVFDVKVHDINNNIVPLNDAAAIEAIIKDRGELGIMIAAAEPTFDKNGEFKIWHNKIKGKKSKYVSKNGRSRKRKSAMKIKFVSLYVLNEETINSSAIIQMHQGVNSNSAKRPMKYSLDISLLKPVSTVVFE